MSYLGDVRLGQTLDTSFCSVAATGAPTTLAGSPVISAYPGNSTTQLTAGITLTVDFDAVTGYNHVRIVASGGNGYATATDYRVVITTGTVSSVSVVGYVVAEFSIENRSALMPTTAARTLVVDAAGLADANVVKIGPTGSGTAQTARDVGASVIAASVTGNVGGNVTGSVGSVVGAVGSVTGAVGSVTGAVGSVTGAVGSLTVNNDKTGYTLSNTGMDNILDRAAGVETSVTLRQALRLILAACAGKLSGAATTTVTIRDVNDTKNRVVATVDANGNRTAVTTDVS